MSEITSEEVVLWKKLPVTIKFLGYVAELEEECDGLVHKALSNPKLIEQAPIENAAMEAYGKVLDGPQVMIDDLTKENEEDGDGSEDGTG